MTDKVDIRDFGAVEGSDCTQAFTDAVDSMKDGGPPLYIPSGVWFTSKAVDPSHLLNGVSVIGDNMGRRWKDVGSVILGDVPDCSTFRYAPATGADHPIRVENVWFHQGSETGRAACHIENVMSSSVRGCGFTSRSIGLLGSRTFGLTVDTCRFAGVGRGKVGAVITGHTEFLNADVTGWEEGVRASGTTCNIRGGRVEQNGIGLNLGTNETREWLLSRSVIDSVSMEANDTAVFSNTIIGCALRAITHNGSGDRSFSERSQVGFDIRKAKWSKFECLIAHGTHDVASFRLWESGVERDTQRYVLCRGQNNSSETGVPWLIEPGGTMPEFVQCDEP